MMRIYDLRKKKIAQLFGVKRPAVTKHLSNIFKEGELDKDSVCSKMEHAASDGKRYQTIFYYLDAIISVGYRMNSRQATMFRIWAPQFEARPVALCRQSANCLLNDK